MPIRDLLLALPFVVSKRLNAREGFFTAGRMFALLATDRILLRLATPTGEAVVERDQAQPLGDPDLAVGLSWVSVPLPASNPEEIERLLTAAHDAVRRASRCRLRPGLRRRRRVGRTVG